MSDIEKKWYVVRAISGQEKKIKDVLEAEIAAEDKISAELSEDDYRSLDYCRS